MDTADYWSLAQEYSIWNATIASLQFWTEDLDNMFTPHSSTHLQVTHYASNLMKHCLDVSS